MKFSTLLLLISIAGLLSSCGSSKFATKAKDGETEMKLSKGVCFGKCPVYTLEIKKGGLAMLDAKNHMTDKLGKYQKKLNKEEYNELLKAFKESDFAQYPVMFDSQIPDLPMVTIGYMTADTLQITKGKEDRPSSLMQLQFRMENIAKSEGWDLVESYDRAMNEPKEEKPQYIYEEIILLPKPGANLPKWFRSYEEFGLRVLKRITPNQNYWLVTFDKGKIEPEKMLEVIKADDNILEAEFNKVTSTREE